MSKFLAGRTSQFCFYVFLSALLIAPIVYAEDIESDLLINARDSFTGLERY